MANLLRTCGVVMLLIPICSAIAQEAESLVDKKVIVIASDVLLDGEGKDVPRAQYGDVDTVTKIDGQRAWLQQKGGWISINQVISAEGALQTWNKRFMEMQDQKEYDTDVALQFAATLSAYNQMTGTQQVTSQIIEKNPEVAEAYRLRGLCLVLESKFVEGLADFERACELKPDSADLRISRAICLVGVGKFDDAMEGLTAVLADEPNHVEARFRRSSVYKLLDQDNTALSELDRVLSLAPQHIKAIRKRVEILRILGQFDLAVKGAQTWVSVDPEDSRSHVLVGDVYLEMEETQKAIDTYTKALEVDPNRLTAMLGRGQARLMLDQREEAFDDFSKAVQLLPDYVPALIERGRMLTEDGEFQKALVDYTQACEFAPENAETHAGLGDVLVALDEPDKAISAYTKALKIDPDWVDLYTSRAGAFLAVGDTASLKAALADSEKAIGLAPDNFYAYTGRAYANQELGELDKAIVDYREAIRLDGPQGEAHRLLGYVLYLNGDLDAALEEFSAAIVLDEDNPEPWRLRGMVRRENGRPEDSLPDLHNAMDLAPDDPEALIETAYSYQEMWDFEGALELTQRALQVAPEDVRALNFRAYLWCCGPDQIRQPAAALKDALQANQLSDGEDPAVLDTLACAYASTGDFQRAEEFGRLAISKATNDETVRSDAATHLELFKKKQNYRLPEDRPLDLEMGPPVDAVTPIKGALDTRFVPAECFAALHARPATILASRPLTSIPAQLFVDSVLNEFGADVRLVEEILVPMFPSRQLPPAVLLRFKESVGPQLATPHPCLDVTGWSASDSSGRKCFTKLGRTTCFVDAHTVITGPRAAVKRMLATDETPSLLRNFLGQTSSDAAAMLRVEFTVCPKYIVDVSQQQAKKAESKAFARFLPDANSFSARLTTGERVALTGTATMNDAIAASRLNLSLTEALQKLRESLQDAGEGFLPMPPTQAREIKAVAERLLSNTTTTSSGTSTTVAVKTDDQIDAMLVKIGNMLTDP